MYYKFIILGAVLLRISCHSSTGQSATTRQMIYVTDSLSREACVALGIISERFPLVQAPVHHSAADVHDSSAVPCGCPIRELPLLPPDALPFPIYEGCREKLQQFLLDYYRSSTFNTCEHQQLPLMDSPPMRLMIDPDAKPVAHHTSVPVPLHWRDAVKDGLDQDVCLRAIEKVPIGELLHGAIEWLSVQRKMANLDELWTFKHSMCTPLVKHITPHLLFCKHDLFQLARRRLCLTLGMDITAYQYTRMTNI